jgi:hypothetical protein
MGRKASGAPTLVRLAKRRFGKRLLDAELRLARHAAEGRAADFGHDDPSCGEAWPVERTLSADFLRWLLADAEARPHIGFRGVHVVGARVMDELELRGARIDVRATLHMCALNRVWLEDATVSTFSLSGSRCAGLDAQRLHVRGALFLSSRENRRFTASATVDLRGANIEGELNCGGAQLAKTEGETQGALDLEGARIEGSALLHAGFHSQGTIVLRGARIGGSLECPQATLVSADGPAMDADAIDVAHSMVLSEGFSADGSVELADARIGHNLRCLGGSFRAHGEVALNASRFKVAGGAAFGGPRSNVVGKIVLSEADIGGSLHLTDTAKAPRVELYRAHVHTDVVVDNVQFTAGGQPGLIAKDATVDGELCWRNVTPAAGTQLDLRGAEVATLGDGLQNWPEEVDFKPRYEGLTYRRFTKAPSEEEVGQRIRWLGREAEFSPQPYDQLAATLQASGHQDRSVDVAIAREDDRRRRGGLGSRGRAWSWILKQFIGSGYKPYKALAWSLVFVVAGALVFGFAENDGHFVQTTAKATPFKPVVYSLDTFLPIADLQQERFRAPGGDGFWAGSVQVYFWLHVLAGWTLVTLGILGLTGLIRTK